MNKPRIKPEHAPYRISGNRIRIGGPSFGIASEINDPSGVVWTLLCAMDGTRNIEEIVSSVIQIHPYLAAATIRSALQDIVASGYVEDFGAIDPSELTERDRVRYDRSLRYFRWLDMTPRSSSWEPQAALRRSKVTIVGIGGTGGAAAMALAASGVGQLVCVDADTVELSNLNRQVLYTEDDIGQPKVHAAVRRLRHLNADIEIIGRQLWVGGVDDLTPLALDCDVLVVAADRPKDIRMWANRACLSASRPWVDTGYHGPLVSVAWYMPGEGACWECLRAANDEIERAEGVYSEDASYRRQAVVEAVAAPSAGLSGCLAAHVTISLLTGIAKMPVAQLQAVNLVALDTPYTFTSPRRVDCPGCGPLMRKRSTEPSSTLRDEAADRMNGGEHGQEHGRPLNSDQDQEVL